MTSIDATFAYAVERAGRLSAGRLSMGAQRVLMALLTAVLLEQLLLPNPLLSRWTGYADPGGMPLLKIHFYSYTLFLALLFVVLCVGLVGFVAEQCVERPGVVQFAAVVLLCTAVTVIRQGVGGVAYMVDTLFAAPLGVMLAFYLDQERRQRLTAMIISFVTLNAVIAIAERLVGIHLFNFPELDNFDYFRATALMGHPLENAFITSSVMFLVPAMPWPAWRKFLVLSVCTAAILAFGARSSFALSIMIGITACVFFGARALLRGEMRLSTLAAAPWIAVLLLAFGTVLTFGTVLGERIVQAAKFDASAQARVDVFRLFHYLSIDDLLYGVDFDKIIFLLKTNKEVDIIENCWIAMLLMLGAILFVVFVPSLLGFLRSIARGRGAIAGFAVLNFLLVASTNNSISTKTPSLAIFAMAVIGVSTRQRQQRGTAAQPVLVQLSPGYGGWS